MYADREPAAMFGAEATEQVITSTPAPAACQARV